MEVKEYRVVYSSRASKFRLFPIGDIHAGTKHCAENDIKRKVTEIKDDPFALWIGMGDYAECITPNDKRWDVKVIADWVEQSNVAESQRKWVKKLFEPIANKCIGLIEGNHEVSIRLNNNQDIYLDLCRDLSVTPLGYSCFIRFFFSRRTNLGDTSTFTGVFQHGSGGAQTEGGQIMRLKKMMDMFDADIYAMGHLHSKKVNTIPLLYLNVGMNIRAKVKVGAITGSWMKSYTEGISPGYAEMKGLYPTVLGCPEFIVVPNKNILQVVG